MIEALLAVLGRFVVALISAGGYLGIVLAMAIESACIPLPSEIIMPFSGYLVYTGHFKLLPIGLAGAFGCLVGSAVAYVVGYYGGRPLLERYGRYLLIRLQDLEWADRWFARYGDGIIFTSRLMPVIRTFISLPAGIARMPFAKFAVYTFAGSLPWCLGLGYIGMVLGENWTSLHRYFHDLDLVIGVLLLAGFAYFLYHHWPRQARSANPAVPVAGNAGREL